MISARLLRGGFKVIYESDARVFHSHNLTVKEQFRRNYAVGRFLSENADELNVASEVGEGSRLVCNVANRLAAEHQFSELVRFGIDCAARLLGNRVGRAAGKKGLLGKEYESSDTN